MHVIVVLHNLQLLWARNLFHWQTVSPCHPSLSSKNQKLRNASADSWGSTMLAPGVEGNSLEAGWAGGRRQLAFGPLFCEVRQGSRLSWFRMLYLEESSFTFYLCSCLLSSALEPGYIPRNIVLLQSNSVDLNVLTQPRESHKVLSYYLKLHFL